MIIFPTELRCGRLHSESILKSQIVFFKLIQVQPTIPIQFTQSRVSQCSKIRVGSSIARTRPGRVTPHQIAKSLQDHLNTFTMPTIRLHPRSSEPTTTTKATESAPSYPVTNPLPQLLQTPSGLALLELQGTINVPTSGNENEDATQGSPGSDSNSPSFETPIGKLMFPDYSAHNPDDTKWMKRAYLYVGRYQRMTGEVKKLPRPIAVLRKRSAATEDELEVVEIVRYKVFFKNRPEPVNDA